MSVSPSAGDGSGGRRASRSALGRNTVRIRHAQRRRARRRCKRHHRVVPRAPGAFQGAEVRRIRAAAENDDRQDPEIRAARTRPRARNLG